MIKYILISLAVVITAAGTVGFLSSLKGGDYDELLKSTGEIIRQLNDQSDLNGGPSGSKDTVSGEKIIVNGDTVQAKTIYKNSTKSKVAYFRNNEVLAVDSIGKDGELKRRDLYKKNVILVQEYFGGNGKAMYQIFYDSLGTYRYKKYLYRNVIM